MSNLEMIKTLRERTHLGMNDCKRALEEASDDMDRAIEILQKKGLKKVDDLIVPMEGQVRAQIGRNDVLELDFGYIVEINCQTDFGAKSEIFEKFITDVMTDPNVTKEMLQPSLEMVSKQLGEKVVIRRSKVIDVEKFEGSSISCAYNHLGGKIAVILVATTTDENVPVLEYLENVAMQIAAMKPLAITRNQLPQELVAQQLKKLFESDVGDKPEAIKKKIVEGKLNKWYSEVCLLDQDAIFLPEGSPKQTIQGYLIDKLGINVTIREFIRYERGEEIKNV